jgi:serine/threonine protein kinase
MESDKRKTPHSKLLSCLKGPTPQHTDRNYVCNFYSLGPVYGTCSKASYSNTHMDLTDIDVNTVNVSYFGDREVIFHPDDVAACVEVGRGNSGVVHVVTLLNGARYYVKTVSGGDPSYHRREIDINMYISRRAPAFVSQFLAGFIRETANLVYAVQIFQFLPGMNAADYLSQRPDQIHVVRRAAIYALRSIHATGVLHGDISLSNIFIALGSRGQISVRFIDFGGSCRGRSGYGYRINLQRLEHTFRRLAR